MENPALERSLALAPIIMSVLVLATLIHGIIVFHDRPLPADEEWHAHIFQILMVLQLPLILAYFAIHLPSLRRSLPIVSVQVSFWLLNAVLCHHFFN